MKPVTLSRQRLYEDAWKTPLRKLALQYGVSDVALGKACRKHGIPLPGRGHWTQVAHGKSPARPRLPSAESRTKITLYPDRKQAAPWKPEGPFGEITAASASGSLRHPLVISTARLLLAQRADLWDRVLPPDGALKIHVKRPNIPRALRMFDALALALESEGGKIVIHKEDRSHLFVGGGQRFAYTTNVEIGGEVIQIEMNEPKPGVLCFEFAYSAPIRRKWCDTARAALETRLTDIGNAMVAAIPLFRKQREEAETAEAARKAAEARREEEETARLTERARRRSLLREARRMHQADHLRRYAQALLAKHPDDEKIQAWAEWAHAVANSIDPLAVADAACLRSVSPKTVRPKPVPTSFWGYPR